MNVSKIDASLVIKFTHKQDVWLLNCYEGYQHFFIKHHLKINQISKIFLTDLNSNNIAGLFGLLSSLNLMNRSKPISLYAPYGLQYYLDLVKKYSRTNFTYAIFCYLYKFNYLFTNKIYKLRYDVCRSYAILSIFSCEYQGQFDLCKAIKWHLNKGPLYGKLKTGTIFLLPDGTILNGLYFTYFIYPGRKVSIVSNLLSLRLMVEQSKKTTIIVL
uniref:Ribonuclease Z n=1 Tax=Crouania attenuata TaxID=42002 RepID=A0A4D6WP37_9FLOR|nr:ribonuclease Z [Crouania attenuata]